MKAHHASQHFGHLFGSAVACYLTLIPLFHLTTFGNASPVPLNQSASSIWKASHEPKSHGQSLPLPEESPFNGNLLPESDENQNMEDSVNISNIHVPTNKPVNHEGLGSVELINSQLAVNKPGIVQTKQPSIANNITGTEKKVNVTSLNDSSQLEVTSKSNPGKTTVTTATAVIGQSTSTTEKGTPVDPLTTKEDPTSLLKNSTDARMKFKNDTLHSEEHTVTSNTSPKPSQQQIVKVEPAGDDSKEPAFTNKNNKILPKTDLTQSHAIPVELHVSAETNNLTKPTPTAIGMPNSSEINAQFPSNETKFAIIKLHSTDTSNIEKSQSSTTASKEKVPQLIPSAPEVNATAIKVNNKPLESITNPAIPKPSPVVPEDNMESLDVESETPMTSVDSDNLDDPGFGNDDPKKMLNKADMDEDDEQVDQPNTNPADGFKKNTDEFDDKDFEKPRGNLGSLKPPDHVTEFPEQEDSHFFAYFVTAIIVFIIGYLVVHNKQKILGLIVEGRTGRRRRSHVYKRLENDGTKFNQIF